MKNIMRLLAIFIVILQLISIPPSLIYANEISEEEQQEIVTIISVEDATEFGLNYLSLNQDEYGAWEVSGDYVTANIANILEYEILIGYENEKLSDMLSLSIEYFKMRDILNCDDLSCLFLINSTFPPANLV